MQIKKIFVLSLFFLPLACDTISVLPINSGTAFKTTNECSNMSIFVTTSLRKDYLSIHLMLYGYDDETKIIAKNLNILLDDDIVHTDNIHIYKHQEKIDYEVFLTNDYSHIIYNFKKHKTIHEIEYFKIYSNKYFIMNQKKCGINMIKIPNRDNWERLQGDWMNLAEI